MAASKSQSTGNGEVTEPTFLGFGAAVFEWFEGLEHDNSRIYFDATRQWYEVEVRGAFTSMLRELSTTFGGEVRVFRQQNDMRFTPGVPYKTRTYGVLEFTSPPKARVYADISARGLYAGSGYHRLASDQLIRYRAAVADDHLGTRLVENLAVTSDAGLEAIGDSLRLVPRGYSRDHPRAELLRNRSLLVGKLLSNASGIGRDDALSHVATSWRAAAPLCAWLDEHVGQSALSPRERWPRRPAAIVESGS